MARGRQPGLGRVVRCGCVGAFCFLVLSAPHVLAAVGSVHGCEVEAGLLPGVLLFLRSRLRHGCRNPIWLSITRHNFSFSLVIPCSRLRELASHGEEGVLRRCGQQSATRHQQRISRRPSPDLKAEGSSTREHNFLDWNVESLGKPRESRCIREGLHVTSRNLLDTCSRQPASAERSELLVGPIALPIGDERLQLRVLNVHGTHLQSRGTGSSSGTFRRPPSGSGGAPVGIPPNYCPRE